MPAPAHTPVAPPRVAPPPPTLPSELLQLVHDLTSRLNRLDSDDIPNLGTCRTSLAEHEQRAGEVRVQLGIVRKDVEELKLQVDDLDKARDRRAGADHVVQIQSRLEVTTRLYRQAVISSKRLIDSYGSSSGQFPSSASARDRDELFSSISRRGDNNGAGNGATPDQSAAASVNGVSRRGSTSSARSGGGGREPAPAPSLRKSVNRAGGLGAAGSKKQDTPDDALMAATSDVTDGLRRTLQLMQQEVDRSMETNEMLEAQTATMQLTSDSYSTLSTLLHTSRALITSLERADLLDRLILLAAFLLFALVCAWVLKRRVVDKGLRVASAIGGVVGVGGSKGVKAAVHHQPRAVGQAVTSVVAAATSAAIAASQSVRPRVERVVGKAKEQAESVVDRVREQIKERAEPSVVPVPVAEADEDEGEEDDDDDDDDDDEEEDDDGDEDEDQSSAIEPKERHDEISPTSSPVVESVVAENEEPATTAPPSSAPASPPALEDLPTPTAEVEAEVVEPSPSPEPRPTAAIPEVDIDWIVSEPEPTATEDVGHGDIVPPTPSEPPAATPTNEDVPPIVSADSSFTTAPELEPDVAPSPELDDPNIIDESDVVFTDEEVAVDTEAAPPTPSEPPSATPHAESSSLHEVPAVTAAPEIVDVNQDTTEQEDLTEEDEAEPMPTLAAPLPTETHAEEPMQAEVDPVDTSDEADTITTPAAEITTPTFVPEPEPGLKQPEREFDDEVSDADLGFDAQPIVAVFRNTTPTYAETTPDEKIFTPLESFRPATPIRSEPIEDTIAAAAAVPTATAEDEEDNGEDDDDVEGGTIPEYTPPDASDDDPVISFTDDDGTVWTQVPSGHAPAGSVMRPGEGVFVPEQREERDVYAGFEAFMGRGGDEEDEDQEDDGDDDGDEDDEEEADDWDNAPDVYDPALEEPEEDFTTAAEPAEAEPPTPVVDVQVEDAPEPQPEEVPSAVNLDAENFPEDVATPTSVADQLFEEDESSVEVTAPPESTHSSLDDSPAAAAPPAEPTAISIDEVAPPEPTTATTLQEANDNLSAPSPTPTSLDDFDDDDLFEGEDPISALLSDPQRPSQFQAPPPAPDVDDTEQKLDAYEDAELDRILEESGEDADDDDKNDDNDNTSPLAASTAPEPVLEAEEELLEGVGEVERGTTGVEDQLVADAAVREDDESVGAGAPVELPREVMEDAGDIADEQQDVFPQAY